jgi:hypothetical protein
VNHLSQLLCRLDVHGPAWYGGGPDADLARNTWVSPHLRGCKHCGTHWLAHEEGVPGERTLSWSKLEPAAHLRGDASTASSSLTAFLKRAL